MLLSMSDDRKFDAERVLFLSWTGLPAIPPTLSVRHKEENGKHIVGQVQEQSGGNRPTYNVIVEWTIPMTYLHANAQLSVYKTKCSQSNDAFLQYCVRTDVIFAFLTLPCWLSHRIYQAAEELAGNLENSPGRAWLNKSRIPDKCDRFTL